VRFFPDAPGFIEMDGTTYLTFYVNKLVQSKLGGFTSAVKVAEGQYRFRVGERDVYVLWSGVPSSLSGRVTATDFYGNATTTDASLIAPSESSPLFVESMVSRRRAVSHARSMAEEVGFEPTVPFPVRRFSRPLP
jgi:hypothetical protein